MAKTEISAKDQRIQELDRAKERKAKAIRIFRKDIEAIDAELKTLTSDAKA